MLHHLNDKRTKLNLNISSEEHCTEHFNDNNFKSAEKDEEANEATKRCGHLEVNVTDYQKKQNYHLALESEVMIQI